MLREFERAEPSLCSKPIRGLRFVIINSLFRKIFTIFSLGLIISGLGCNKSGEIGLSVLPDSDIIGGSYSDTTTLVAYTVLADSLRTDWAILNPLGSYIDPVFGQSTASFYLKFSMTSNNINFGNGFTPDSLVMTLAYNGYYGEAPVPQTIMVFQLSPGFVLDGGSPYYSTSNLTVDPVDLGGAIINPSDDDISISFKLNDPIFTSADSLFATNDAFQSFIGGFYVLFNPMQPGGMLYMDVNSPTTKLTLYYDSTASFVFEIDGESGWFNRFQHTYAGTAIEAQLADPSSGDSLVYVQPMGGTMVKIEMPYITDWDSIVVNKAELVLSVYDDGTLDTYEVPDNLFILGAGDDPVITDQNQGATHFGGTYNAADKTYSFDIARYVHELIHEGRSNDGIYLIVPNNLLTSGSVVSANRVILGGVGHSSLGMKLNLVYTEI